MSEHHVEKKKVMRFPRENATLAALDAKALAGIERGRKVNIEVGHIFREIKAEIRRALGHGHWRQHFKDTFVPRGISLRTAQEWMRMARKEKNAESALSASASDSQAEAVRDATEAAKAEEGCRRRLEKRVLDQQFRQLTSDLLRSASWPAARRELIAALDQLQTKLINKRKEEPRADLAA